MLTENTVNKLYEMRLTAMAKAFKDQMTDPNISKISFEDRFGLLVDQEWTSRKNNHLSSPSPEHVSKILNTTQTETWIKRRWRGCPPAISSQNGITFFCSALPVQVRRI